MKAKRSVSHRPTLLIVDDDSIILMFLTDILTPGFHLLTASNGAEGLRLSKEYDGEINLLLTDFEMPGMNGIELATKMTAERPKLQVLMMSGFVGGMLVLNEGWHFLPKPFIASNLITLLNGLIAPAKSKFTAAGIGKQP